MKKEVSKTQKKRIWEVDFFRGLAVIGMIYFHYFYILNYLQIQNVSLFDGGWEDFGNAVRNTFFIVVGIGMVLSLQRYLAKGKPLRLYYLKELKKGFILISLGLLITLWSTFAIPDQVIHFGVLSFIGTSVILLLPFIRYGILTAAVTLLILWIENRFEGVWYNESLFGYILGFYPGYWPSLDYFGLVPWMASLAGGATLAHVIFKDAGRRYPFLEKTPKVLFPIVWIGQHALWIYITHLPISLALVLFLDKINVY